MAPVLEYMERSSWVHRLNPLSKLLWALGIMVLALAYNDIKYLLVVLGLVLLIGLQAQVLGSLTGVVKGLSIFAGILVILQVLFYRGNDVLFYILPNQTLPVTKEALLLGLAMGLRMMTVVLSFLVFLTTTQFKDIILVFTEKLRLPYDYVFMFMTALRFVPTFMTEALQVSYAQQVRGCPVDSGNPLQKIQAYVAIALPLVFISLKKAERLAIAMETRGYGSGKRTYYKEPVISKVDKLVMVLIVLLIGLALVLRIQGLGSVHY